MYVESPKTFPVKTIVPVIGNAGLNGIANSLYVQHVISSPFVFRGIVIIMHGERSVMAGDYFFEKPANVFEVASRLSAGIFGLTPVKITFPEGSTSRQMSVLLENQLFDFNANEFLEMTKTMEGYLFPDTYQFSPNAKVPEVVDIFKKNFDQKVASIDTSIKSFKKPLKDIVIMASILEAEARTTETRKVISGILWKRLEIGMPLQVDAPFQYIIGKNTFQLTLNDLKFDSPYNTYKYKGLPPTGIGNAGLDSLLSAVTPTKSSYLFYLSDIHGDMHYAKTFEEHVSNKEKYLK